MKNAFYAQSGGVTAVINASACGVIETARQHRDKIGKVYAGRHGIIGALTEDMIDTSKESRAAISALRHTPGGAFGSARYKLAGIDKNRAQYERLIDIFRAHDIGYFFYNGGNDSMDTAQKVSEIAVQMDLSHHLHRHPEDRRQRSAHHRLLPGFRLRRQVHCRIHPRGGARRGLHGAHLHQGIRARGHGTACRLDGRCRADSPARQDRRCAAHHSVSRNRLRSRALPRESQTLRGEIRLLRGRGLRRRARLRRQISRRGRHQGRLRPLAAGRRRPGGRADDPGSLRLQIPLGGRRLSCSVRRGISPPRWTSIRPTRSARPPSNWPSRAGTPSCRSSCANRRNPIAGASARRP